MNDFPGGFARHEIEKTGQLLGLIANDAALLDAVERATSLCVEAVRTGHKIIFAGNGGSAADAQHLSAELVGKLAYDRPGLPSLALTTDTSAMTAIGNDYGYDFVFSRQIEAIGGAGDVFIGISTSGRSRNLVKAFEAARAKGIVTIGFTGSTGGDMRALSDLWLRVPSDETQKIQEAQIVLGHIVCGMIERTLFPRSV